MFQEINAPAADGQNDAAMEFDESKFPKFSEIDPANTTPEQVAELVKAGQTLLGQTKHWYKKGKSPVVVEPPLKTNPAPTAEPEAMAKLQADVSSLKTVEEKRRFGHVHSLSPEETDNVFAYAQGTGKKPSEALNDPFIKSGLQSMREQANADGAIPGPSSRSPLVDGKPFSEMKRDDKVKNFGKYVAASQKRK